MGTKDRIQHIEARLAEVEAELAVARRLTIALRADRNRWRTMARNAISRKAGWEAAIHEDLIKEDETP